MSTNLYVVILILLSIQLLAADLMKIVKIESCLSSNKTLTIDRCDVVDGKLNFVYTILKPISKAQIRFEMARKVGANDYRQLFKMPDYEWCSMINGLLKIKNPMLKTIMKAIKESAKEVFVPCPHTGTKHLLNLTFERNTLSWLPSGTYKLSWGLWDDDDKNMMKVVMYSTLDK